MAGPVNDWWLLVACAWLDQRSLARREVHWSICCFGLISRRFIRDTRNRLSRRLALRLTMTTICFSTPTLVRFLANGKLAVVQITSVCVILMNACLFGRGSLPIDRHLPEQRKNERDERWIYAGGNFAGVQIDSPIKVCIDREMGCSSIKILFFSCCSNE